MAQLNPQDPQYGIPVSARIRKELAHHFNEQAAKAGKSLSRYVSEFIEASLKQEAELKELLSQIEKAAQKISAQEKQLTELSLQIEKITAVYKTAVGKFILTITEGNEEKAKQYIQIYNTLLKK